MRTMIQRSLPWIVMAMIMAGCSTVAHRITDTNLLASSEDFSDPAWQKVSAAAIPHVVPSWDGRMIGNKIIGLAGNGNHAIVYTAAAKPAVAEGYTLSVECKAAEFDWCSVQLFDHEALGMVWFHLTGDGSIGYRWGAVSPSISALGNGWYRCAIVVTSGLTTNAWESWLRPEPADGQTYDYMGDGTSGGFMTRACLQKVSPGSISR